MPDCTKGVLSGWLTTGPMGGLSNAGGSGNFQLQTFYYLLRLQRGQNFRFKANYEYIELVLMGSGDWTRKVLTLTGCFLDSWNFSRNSRGAPNVYLKSSKNNRMAEKVENRKKENEKSKIQTFKQRSLVIQRLAIQMLRNSSALQEAYIVTFNL